MYEVLDGFAANVVAGWRLLPSAAGPAAVTTSGSALIAPRASTRPEPTANGPKVPMGVAEAF